MGKFLEAPTYTITQRVNGREAGGDSWGNQTCRERSGTSRRAMSNEGIVGKVLCWPAFEYWLYYGTRGEQYLSVSHPQGRWDPVIDARRDGRVIK